MKVKLTQSLAGDRFCFKVGDNVECSHERGAQLVKNGLAVEMAADVPVAGTMHEPLTDEEKLEAEQKRKARQAEATEGR